MSEKDAVPVPLITPMEALVAQAMAEKLSQEAKDKLLTNAIASLLRERKTGSWNETYPSDLAEAFNKAVRDVAQGKVAEMLKEDTVLKERIKVLVELAVTRIADSDMMAELLTKLVEKALSAALNNLR